MGDRGLTARGPLRCRDGRRLVALGWPAGERVASGLDGAPHAGSAERLKQPPHGHAAVPSGAVEGEDRVCPRCGHRAGESRYCPSCGLNLGRLRELPTRDEWRSRRRNRRLAAGPTIAVGAVLAAVLVGGAYLLGAALGDNSGQVRAAENKGHREGLDKGRRRGSRTTYESASRHAQGAPTAPSGIDASATASSVTDCGSVTFTPNSDDGTSSITATGVGCAEAEDVVRAVRGGATSAAGFTCESAEQPNGPPGGGMAQTLYTCTRGDARIEWAAS